MQALDPAKIPAVRAQIWDPDPRRAAAPRPARRRTQPGRRRLRRLRAAPRRLPLRDQGRADPRRAAHPRRARRHGEALVNLRARGAAGQADLGRRAARVPGLRQALAERVGLDEQALLAEPGARSTVPDALTRLAGDGPARTGVDAVDLLEALARRLVSGWRRAAGTPDRCRGGAPRSSATAVRGRRRCWSSPPPRSCRGWRAPPTRSTNVLRALDGRYVPAGPVRLADPRAGQRAADRPQLLLRRPEGDPVAQRLGRRRGAGRVAARAAPRRHRRVPALGRPDRLGHLAMRTQGDDIAEVLALLGCRPVWDDASRRVTGFEVVPARRAGPAADRRDGPHLRVLPRRVPARHRAARRRGPAVAELDEPAERQLRRARTPTPTRRARRPRGAPPPGSSAPSPGAYGAGLLPLIDARDWRTDADLAEVYAVWGGYAYGRGLDGREARGDMETAFRRIAGRGEEPGQPRARHRRLRRLLPVPRRHGRDGAVADRHVARRPTSATRRCRTR